MKLLGQYIRRHVKGLLLAILCAGVFAAVFSLYDLPAEAVLYACLLCLAVLGTAAAIGFFRFCRRHKRLADSLSHIAEGVAVLPAPDHLIERDYQELIRVLLNRIQSIEAEAAFRYTDMMDYYTMWVHQIKTPIAAMRLLLQAGAPESGAGPNDPEPAEGAAAGAGSAAELEEQLFRVEQYVEMVLQYLRSDSLSGDLVIRRVPLDAMVRQAVRKYARSFIRRKIRLELGELDLPVLTDEKWFVFVVEQLLSNALKYTAENGTVFIGLVPGTRTLEFRDTGIGIRPEDLPRIFDKGYTGFNGRGDMRSTGIGLYLCRRITARLSHTLAVDSVLGKGTTATLGLDIDESVLE